MLLRNERAAGRTGPNYYSIWNKSFFQTGLYPCTSSDGVNFTTRSTAVTYTPVNSSVFGCPTLMYWNGKIWMAGSMGVDFGWTGSKLEIASSTDGDTFTWVASPDFASILGSGNQVWTNNWFPDDDGSLPYLTLETDNTSDPNTESVFICQALNSSLTSFSTPTNITAGGTGFPASIQNVVIRKIAGTYYLFFKNQTSRCIEVATSSTVSSGYTVIKTGDWAGWGHPREAPVLLRLGNTWRMYLDAEGGGILRSDSLTSDPLGSWTVPAFITCDFGTAQHGSVIVNPTGH